MMLMWASSYYDFLNAASSPKSLVEVAHQLGWRALVLADSGGVSGIVKAHARATQLGMRLIVGTTLKINANIELTILPQNHQGYHNMCILISMMHNKPGGLDWYDLEQFGQDVLVMGLADALSVETIVHCATTWADRFYLVVTRQSEGTDRHIAQSILVANRQGVSIVAGHRVYYDSPTQKPLLDVLRCIKYRCKINDLIQHERPREAHAIISTVTLRRRFKGQPQWLEQLNQVASRISFSLDSLNYRYPGEFVPSGHSSERWLSLLTWRGARRRYGTVIPENVQRQLEHELKLIQVLDYSGYFLTMARIVKFCRRQRILCQGRGSAANSAVCYCLGLTAVDPVKMNLLFERFLSMERQEPPDIDLDIEHERREEVIEFVYRRYGTSHAAMVCTIITFRTKSAIGEVGKVFDLAPHQIATLSKRVGSMRDLTSEDVEAVWPQGVPSTMPHVLKMIEAIRGLPRHLGTHPGGFILGQAPIHTLVPTQATSMPGRTIIQWDKNDVETMGLFKLDLLGLGALSCIRRAFHLLAQHQKQHLSLATIPQDDAKTYAMIQRADTLGVFQIESRAQMSMLPRLKPTCFYDLVVEISLVRPGPVAGDMVHPYLRRRQGLEAYQIHPKLQPVLARTLGVPLFQEQVMRVAMIAADYSPGQADQLRRDMASWQSLGKIERHRCQLISGMMKNGYSLDFSQRLFRQIQGFGSYGFPESHAASFALLAYATAYLRAHFPAIFACALLQSQPMGFYAPHSIVEDARRRGVHILPVCLAQSTWRTELERCPRTDQLALRLGLRWVKGLSRAQGDRIVSLRAFKDIVDVVRRARLSKRVGVHLALCGAFACFDLNRRDALWAWCGHWAHQKESLPLPHEPLGQSWQDDQVAKTIARDYTHLGMSALGHCILPFRQTLLAQGLPDAVSVNQRASTHAGYFLRYAAVVIGKQRPSTASGTVFLTLEDETGMVNVIIHCALYEQHRAMIRLANVLGVYGQLQYEQGVVHLKAHDFWHPQELASLNITQRNFR